MASFHSRGYGFSSQFAVNATAKKMAKSIVGNSMRGSHPLFGKDALRDSQGVKNPAEASAVRTLRRTGWGRPGHLRALRAWVSLGTTLWTFPFKARAATEKMGASWSLLMAMM